MLDTVPYCVNSSDGHLTQYCYRQVCDYGPSIVVERTVPVHISLSEG